MCALNNCSTVTFFFDIMLPRCSFANEDLHDLLPQFHILHTPSDGSRTESSPPYLMISSQLCADHVAVSPSLSPTAFTVLSQNNSTDTKLIKKILPTLYLFYFLFYATMAVKSAEWTTNLVSSCGFATQSTSCSSDKLHYSSVVLGRLNLLRQPVIVNL